MIHLTALSHYLLKTVNHCHSHPVFNVANSANLCLEQKELILSLQKHRHGFPLQTQGGRPYARDEVVFLFFQPEAPREVPNSAK